MALVNYAPIVSVLYRVPVDKRHAMVNVLTSNRIQSIVDNVEPSVPVETYVLLVHAVVLVLFNLAMVSAKISPTTAPTVDNVEQLVALDNFAPTASVYCPVPPVKRSVTANAPTLI